MRLICSFFLWLVGWKVIGDVPKDYDKYLIIAAPHSSNWDFPIGLLARGYLGFKSKFLGKKSLFDGPFGWFFRMMGGYPVDRSQSTNLVDQVVDIYDSNEKFVLALAPEGTRKSVNEWKTGFYYIAVQANIPIVRSRIDRANKEVRFFPPLFPTGDIEKDMPKIKEVYS